MSNTYHVICVPCREVMGVGKIVDMTQSGSPRPLGFGGWRDPQSDEWPSGLSFLRLLERWLILHRGHEIRVVPDEFLARADPDAGFHYIHSAAEVMDRPVVPYPDSELDVENVPQDVISRLSIPHEIKPEE